MRSIGGIVMNHNIPAAVHTRLGKFEQAVVDLTARLATTEHSIASVRERLTGGFQKDGEFHDMRMTLDRLLAEQPQLREDLEVARATLRTCTHWLKTLPANASVQLVPPQPGNGGDLDAVRERIAEVEQAIAELEAVPVPSADIDARITAYVQSLGRPEVSGIGDGEPFAVSWPHDTPSLLAFLLPTEMAAALRKEIDRVSNDPLPLPARQQKIAELKRDIDQLQRQSLALGEDASSLPPEVVLGCKVAPSGNGRARERQIRHA
jgi:hypothetical protein